MPDPPLRFALVGPVHPYRGGIAQFTEQMAGGLAARGHEVSAVTFSRQYPEVLFPGKTQYVEEARGEGALDAPRLIDSVNPLTWRSAARALVRGGPDAVVFMHWMPFFAPAFGLIARRAERGGAKALALVHNALPHEPRPGDRALSRYFLRALGGCVVLSDAVGRDLRGLGYGGPLRCVPHPIYDRFGEALPKAEARAALGIEGERPVLLFFGFVRRYKGLHVLLDALPSVLEAVPEALLVVAGEFYDDDAPYRAQVEAHGLGEAVRFVPEFIPEAEVARYFSAADVVVQPYVSATQSGVAQVAFQFERPLIVTDVGGLAEVVPDGEAGLVVPPEDPAALADAIARFFAEDMSAALASGVRAAKARYGWDPLYEALEALARAESD